MTTNWLSDALHLLAIGAVVCVALFVFLMRRLDPAQSIAKYLPRVLIYLTIAAIGLFVTTPASWTGPIAAASVVFAVCATLAARDRANAMVTLIGICLFTIGTLAADELIRVMKLSFGQVFLVAAAGSVALLGLFCLTFRRELLKSGVIATNRLWKNPMAWARLSALGILAAWTSIQSASHEHVLATGLGIIAGASSVSASIVFVFMQDKNALAGTMLTLTGTSVTGLGLLAFSSRDFVGGLAGITIGVAVAGGGLWLLDSAGFMGWLKRQFKSQPPA